MKKNIIRITIIFIIIVGGFITYELYLKRTPEKILLSQFGISLKGYNYSIISNKEQWDYNGDGYCLILIDLAKFRPDDFKNIVNPNFLKLPIIDKIETNEIPEFYLKGQNGYYLLELEKEDSHDFKIFIINTDTKKAILYYQIM
ncbi:MAG TPA: hypothetical protein P5084_04040 [Paludibacter sp.]|nr:hypothetical protein [Paludibacter sp.]